MLFYTHSYTEIILIKPVNLAFHLLFRHLNKIYSISLHFLKHASLAVTFKSLNLRQYLHTLHLFPLKSRS